MKRLAAGTLAAMALTLSAACSGPNAPSNLVTNLATATSGTFALGGGTWSTAFVTSPPSPTGCDNVSWTISQNTGLSASGAFSATCAGNTPVSGTGTATLVDKGISWSFTGTATPPGMSSCAVTLTGTASFMDNGMLVLTYSGTTCFGPISGGQTLKRS
jgi:hypothetical protein